MNEPFIATPDDSLFKILANADPKKCQHPDTFWSSEQSNFYCSHCKIGMGLAYMAVGLELKYLRELNGVIPPEYIPVRISDSHIAVQLATAIFRPGHDSLQLWFNLTRASWAVLPRVVMEAMPDEWQQRMSKCLNELDETFPSFPSNIEYTVGLKINGNRYTKPPRYLTDYRRPHYDLIETWKQPCKPKV